MSKRCKATRMTQIEMCKVDLGGGIHINLLYNSQLEVRFKN